MDFNLMHVSGKTNSIPATKLAQQSGRDENSIMADARFLDLASGDFRVREHSPALRLGFTNFPMNQFGVQKPSLKAIAHTVSSTLRQLEVFRDQRRQTLNWSVSN